MLTCPPSAFVEFRFAEGDSVWNIIWHWVTVKVKLPRILEKQYQQMRKTSEFTINGGRKIWLWKSRGKPIAWWIKEVFASVRDCIAFSFSLFRYCFSLSSLFLELQVCWNSRYETVLCSFYSGFFSFCASFWIVSLAVFLIHWSFIQCFSISDVVFISNFIKLFLYLSAVSSILCMLSYIFLNIWSTFMAPVLIYCSLNHLCHFLLCFYWLIFLLAMGHISLLLSSLVIFDWMMGIMDFT